MITSEGENLIFILSLPRSGSTLLSIIMGAHTQVCCPPEPWFLLRLAGVYGEPTSEKRFDDYHASLATKAFMNEESFVRSARAFALQTYNDILEKEKKTVFVDKTPRYYHILDFLDQLFPKAKKIWLKRNPLDIAASYKRSWHIGIDVLTGKQLDPAAFDFTEGLHKYIDYFDKKSPYKFEITYENLVSSPKKTIEDLCVFCEIPFRDDMLKINRENELFHIFKDSVVGDRAVLEQKNLHTKSIGRWKKELTEREVESLLGVIGYEALERMNYRKAIGEHEKMILKNSSDHTKNDMTFREDLYRKTRFGAIYHDWQIYRQKAVSLEKYIAELQRDYQEQLNAITGYLNSILASKYLKLGWKLGITKKPDWVDKFMQTRK